MPKRQAIHHVLVGNPENRRTHFFQQSLRRFGHEPAFVVSYRDILRGAISLDQVLDSLQTGFKQRNQIIVRIESPGENFDVEKRLIALGADGMHGGKGAISAHAALRLRPDYGRILYPAQWFAGYRKLLSEIETQLARFPDIALHNSPHDIKCMFDKPKCNELMNRAGLPVAAALTGLTSYDDLRERMEKLGWKRVFVKLAYGSSASGVVAIYASGKTVRAVTSVETIGSGAQAKFYNNLKLRIYHREFEVRRVVNFLCRETAHAEQWLPKASLLGRVFDLRVVVIAGRASHTVVRTSSGPITNLHLGNRRGNLELLQQQMGPAKWKAVTDNAERTANVFPHSLYFGLDILLKPGLRDSTILEANAFGDLLPGVQHRGLNTYEAEVSSRI